MRRIITTAIILIMSISVAGAQLAESESSRVSFDAGLDLYSAYVWRGMAITDEPVAQPAGTLSLSLDEYGSVFAGVWANFDLTDANKTRSTGGLNEIDYTVGYAVDVDDFSFELGHIWYTFPKANGPDYCPSTREVYASAAYNNDLVTPSVTVYHDYADADGTYAVFALDKEIAINEQLTAGLTASLGVADNNFNEYYYNSSENSMVDGNLGAKITYAINEHLSVGATLVWTSLLDSNLRDNSYHSKEDFLWGGLNLAASF